MNSFMKAKNDGQASLVIETRKAKILCSLTRNFFDAVKSFPEYKRSEEQFTGIIRGTTLALQSARNLYDIVLDNYSSALIVNMILDFSCSEDLSKKKSDILTNVCNETGLLRSIVLEDISELFEYFYNLTLSLEF